MASPSEVADLGDDEDRQREADEQAATVSRRPTAAGS
jgi:hypothetical protein